MANKSRLPIVILSNDWHLNEKNIEQIKDLAKQKCELAVSLKVSIIFLLGDIFDHRTGQKEIVLTAFSEILSIFAAAKIKVVAIPGNHDKQEYGSSGSFLESFKFHPGFMYIPIQGGVPLTNVNGTIHFHFLPYLKPDKWMEKFEEAKEYLLPFDEGSKHVLLSHIAVNGSVNNDGSKVETKIAVNDFSDFDLVLLGHYHNQQQVGHNVFHLPSIQQNNFGENAEKGFTIFYDDCTFELHKSKFKEYEKIVIDFDKMSTNGLEVLKKGYSNSNKFIRFEFCGSSEKVKSINKDEFTALGIDVKIKVKEIEDTIQYSETEIKEYTKTSIVVEFAEFCEEKNKNFEEGLTYLTKKLN